MKRFLIFIPFLLMGCDTVDKQPAYKINDSDYIQMIERGVLNGNHYSVLLHKPTGKKILAYNNSMIYLPEPNAEEGLR